MFGNIELSSALSVKAFILTSIVFTGCLNSGEESDGAAKTSTLNISSVEDDGYWKHIDSYRSIDSTFEVESFAFLNDTLGYLEVKTPKDINNQHSWLFTLDAGETWERVTIAPGGTFRKAVTTGRDKALIQIEWRFPVSEGSKDSTSVYQISATDDGAWTWRTVIVDGDSLLSSLDYKTDYQRYLQVRLQSGKEKYSLDQGKTWLDGEEPPDLQNDSLVFFRIDETHGLEFWATYSSPGLVDKTMITAVNLSTGVKKENQFKGMMGGLYAYEDKGWLISGGLTGAATGSPQYYLIQSFDYGESWNLYPVEGPWYAGGAFLASNKVGYVGHYLRTEDRGATWRKVPGNVSYVREGVCTSESVCYGIDPGPDSRYRSALARYGKK